LIGKGYRIGASGPDEYDCWSLAVEATRRLGGKVLPLWQVEQMTRCDVLRAFREHREEIDAEVVVGETMTGDLVCDVRRGHIGVLVRGGYDAVLHASRERGQVVLERLDDFRRTFPGAEVYRCA
jgi:hypothetical protein